MPDACGPRREHTLLAMLGNVALVAACTERQIGRRSELRSADDLSY
jgi:hypothetical protein